MRNILAGSQAALWPLLDCSPLTLALLGGYLAKIGSRGRTRTNSLSNSQETRHSIKPMPAELKYNRAYSNQPALTGSVSVLVSVHTLRTSRLPTPGGRNRLRIWFPNERRFAKAFPRESLPASLWPGLEHDSLCPMKLRLDLEIRCLSQV